MRGLRYLAETRQAAVGQAPERLLGPLEDEAGHLLAPAELAEPSAGHVRARRPSATCLGA